jgi:endonuclease III
MDSGRRCTADKYSAQTWKYGSKTWSVVAAMQCRKRWVTLDSNVDRVTTKWIPGEDAQLASAVEKHGKNWAVVAALLRGRTNDQCR